MIKNISLNNFKIFNLENLKIQKSILTPIFDSKLNQYIIIFMFKNFN